MKTYPEWTQDRNFRGRPVVCPGEARVGAWLPAARRILDFLRRRIHRSVGVPVRRGRGLAHCSATGRSDGPSGRFAMKCGEEDIKARRLNPLNPSFGAW
jgi:hypothetical protein